MAGIFITVEGPDGSGKTTQINILKQYLQDKGFSVVLTREPGGTMISEKIRDIILDVDNHMMSDNTEALLYAASRAQHVDEVIKPALEANKVVICDRFLDSSVVYQGVARGMGREHIESINKFATGGLQPHITLLLYIDAEEGIKRKKSQAELDRMECQNLEFHKKVCEGYKQLGNIYSDRVKTINAQDTIQNISEQIKDYINQYLIKLN